MAVSEFQQLFESARPLLLAMHAVPVRFCYDYSAASPVWLKISATIERNSSEADLSRAGKIVSENSRQFCAFLIDRKYFTQDDRGNFLMPDENSAIEHDGYLWRASRGDRKTYWVPEDHEGHVIRFTTAQHGAL